MPKAMSREALEARDMRILEKPDPERIFLAPKCEALSDEGRTWSEDRQDCDESGCEMKAVEYVRLDIAIAGGFRPV